MEQFYLAQQMCGQQSAAGSYEEFENEKMFI
jgi:hypothetical protein